MRDLPALAFSENINEVEDNGAATDTYTMVFRKFLIEDGFN